MQAGILTTKGIIDPQAHVFGPAESSEIFPVLPTRPLRFASDNNAPCFPEVIDALAEANTAPCGAYGDDPYSENMMKTLRDTFDHQDLEAFCVSTGTAANCLALAHLLNGNGAVVCHEEGHIVTDECGAPEFFGGGTVIRCVKGLNGKVWPNDLENHVKSIPRSIHRCLPAVLYITQATELGTIYTEEELQTLCAKAHELNLKVLMDGARLSNAVVSLKSTLADLTWKAGVDVLAFGLTKAGAMIAEAVIFFNPVLAEGFNKRRKRGAQLVSKARYMAVQITVMLKLDLWRKGAVHANRLASRIGNAFRDAGLPPLWPVQANEIFIALPTWMENLLKESGVNFYVYPQETFTKPRHAKLPNEPYGCARFLTAFNTPETDVDDLIFRIKLLGERSGLLAKH